jgi:hypothetical protein
MCHVAKSTERGFLVVTGLMIMNYDLQYFISNKYVIEISLFFIWIQSENLVERF